MKVHTSNLAWHTVQWHTNTKLNDAEQLIYMIQRQTELTYDTRGERSTVRDRRLYLRLQTIRLRVFAGTWSVPASLPGHDRVAHLTASLPLTYTAGGVTVGDCGSQYDHVLRCHCTTSRVKRDIHKRESSIFLVWIEYEMQMKSLIIQTISEERERIGCFASTIHLVNF